MGRSVEIAVAEFEIMMKLSIFFLKNLNTFSLTDTLALPKLNLQFLTLHDYLLRNLNLFRLESTCNEFFFLNIVYMYTVLII